ncbi:MAG TPA: hypothetical protein VFV49_02085 [Thermoanaerobaculia bacterium]|nr:hypothetical protein [Thermoanaerobaculia bacterium]
MKSRTWIRLTAIGAVVALTVLTLSICCTSASIVAQQHKCCKGRCASASSAVPLVALTQAKSRLPMLSTATGPFPVAVSEAAAAGVSSADSLEPRLFAPIATIQLRI